MNSECMHLMYANYDSVSGCFFSLQMMLEQVEEEIQDFPGKTGVKTSSKMDVSRDLMLWEAWKSQHVP